MVSNTDNEESLLMNLYDRYYSGENNFSENEWLQIVKRHGAAIRRIENPSEKLQLAAVKKYGWAINWIKKPSEKVQLEVVKTLNYLPLNITSEKAIKKWHQIQQMKKACL